MEKKTRVQELESQIEGLQDGLKMYDEKCKYYEYVVASRGDTIGKKDTTIKTLDSQVHEYEVEIDNYNLEITRLNNQVEEQKHLLNRRKVENESLEKAAEEDAILKLNRKAVDLRERNDTMENIISGLQKELDEAEEARESAVRHYNLVLELAILNRIYGFNTVKTELDQIGSDTL